MALLDYLRSLLPPDPRRFQPPAPASGFGAPTMRLGAQGAGAFAQPGFADWRQDRLPPDQQANPWQTTVTPEQPPPGQQQGGLDLEGSGLPGFSGLGIGAGSGGGG